MTSCGFVAVKPGGRSNERRSQMSGVFHTVRTTLPGVLRVPKPPGPLVQVVSSKSGADQPSAGAAVM
jgi:hypothetical protein